MIEKTITLQIFTDDENIANEFLYNLIKIHNSQYHEINCVEWKIKDQVKVELSEKFPVVKQLWEESEEEFKKALKLIWGFRTDGWWHYEDQYIKYEICTKDEFWAALNKQVEDRK